MQGRAPTWYWAVPVFTCGFLAALPPLVLAVELGTRRAWAWFATFLGLSVVSFLLVGVGDEESVTASVGACVALVNFVGAAAYSVMTWQKHHPQLHQAPPPQWVRNDPNASAVAGVHLARQRRAEALQIARTDPHMARDLRIGRPDLPRTFDDGGLVDINNAPRSALITWLGLSEAHADQIVATRARIGRFERPDDLMHMVNFHPDLYEMVRDRIVLL